MTERLLPSLIFVIVYLSTFFILVSMIPAGFLYSDKTYTHFSYPDYFDKFDIENIKYFRNTTITWGMNYIVIDFNPDGVNFKFHVNWDTYYSGLMHRTWEYWIFQQAHIMYFETEGHFYISKTDLISAWNPDVNASIFHSVVCNHISVKVWYTDPNITRQDIGKAWDDGELNFGVGFGFDDITTTYSAWDLVGRLLTLQAIEFGPWYIQLIINLPLYVVIAYLIYRLILLAIPFVGGGA